jgi:hypothetical protein
VHRCVAVHYAKRLIIGTQSAAYVGPILYCFDIEASLFNTDETFQTFVHETLLNVFLVNTHFFYGRDFQFVQVCPLDTLRCMIVKKAYLPLLWPGKLASLMNEML